MKYLVLVETFQGLSHWHPVARSELSQVVADEGWRCACNILLVLPPEVEVHVIEVVSVLNQLRHLRLLLVHLILHLIHPQLAPELRFTCAHALDVAPDGQASLCLEPVKALCSVELSEHVKSTVHGFGSDPNF